MVTPTDAGLEWMIEYQSGLAPGPLDTIAVGNGTGAEDAAATSLQSEIDRWTSADAIVDFVPDSGDNTIVYAVIELTGGLELPAGADISEVGVFASSTTPETLVWYAVSSPVPFPSGERNKLKIPMNFNRINP